MKKMWSEEEVNAAIAEYAAAHPAGGKLYLHNIATAIDDDVGIPTSIRFSFVSTSETPCLSMSEVPIMTVAVTSGVDASIIFSAMTIFEQGGSVYADVVKDGSSIIEVDGHMYSFNSQFVDTVQEL